MITRLPGLLSDQIVPLMVIVNEQLEILYTLGNTQGIFRVPSCQAVNDISNFDEVF